MRKILKNVKKLLTGARFVLLFHIVIISISIIAGQPILAVVLSVHIFIGNWLRYFVGAPMHCGLKSSNTDFRKIVRTITLDPISEFLYWNMNWHLEHHIFAGVPFYNLKRLFRTVNNDMPLPRTLLSSWLEMRETWRRQLEEANYEFETPIPNPKGISSKNNVDDIQSSIGDLAPKTLA